VTAAQDAARGRGRQPAPDFELESDADETVKLSDLRGKPVVLYFYPKVRTTRRQPRQYDAFPPHGKAASDLLTLTTATRAGNGC
jgi:peroxiredoxin